VDIDAQIVTGDHFQERVGGLAVGAISVPPLAQAPPDSSAA
jgi:hypothetical protein